MVLQDHISVDKEVIMKKLDEKQMKSISAGGISAALINAFARCASIFIDAGRYIGSSLRRLFDHNMCKY